ncbi:MAG: VWA domain-containing protein [Planctomycetota bacterium]
MPQLLPAAVRAVALSSLVLLGVPAAGLAGFGSSASTLAQGADEEEGPDFSGKSEAELLALVLAERDGVERGVVDELAGRDTRAAAEALVTAYDAFASVHMRRAVLRRLRRFDAVDAAWEPALEHLLEVAIDERRRDIRSAAVEGLGEAQKHGKAFLARLVESTAPDEYRERALELHVRLSGPDDRDWYRGLIARDMGAVQRELSEKGKKGKKKQSRPKRGEADVPPTALVPIVWPSGPIRAAALRAIAADMEEAEVAAILEGDRSLSVVKVALAELARRDSKEAVTAAEQLVKRPDFPSELRELAVEILVEERGTAYSRDLIELALKATTQARLRDRIADLLAEMDDEKVHKQIAKLVGKGKGYARTFAIRAAKRIDDPKLVKKLRKDIKNKDEALAIASIDNLAARRDRESAPAFEKLLEKTKSTEVQRALLRGLSSIYDGENAWVERLVEFTGHEDLDLANIAIDELARLGRTNMLELFVERLASESWSTRLASLRALEGLRSPEVIAPIVGQMQSESGRMLREFSEVLFRLTGQPFGRRANIWARWLKDSEGDVSILSERELEALIEELAERDARRTSRADLEQDLPDFFGVSVDSSSVLFIIDVSGSMSDPLRSTHEGVPGRARIDVAKEELAKAIRGLEEDARFNIYAFSTGVDVFADSIAAVGGAPRSDALEYVSRLGAAGGTNLFAALRKAFDDPDVDTILLLSDGEPSMGQIVDPGEICDEIRRRNQTRGIVIHTIAVGGQLEALRWLARDSGGTYAGVR